VNGRSEDHAEIGATIPQRNLGSQRGAGATAVPLPCVNAGCSSTGKFISTFKKEYASGEGRLEKRRRGCSVVMDDHNKG
jgi:hypothetical protein